MKWCTVAFKHGFKFDAFAYRHDGDTVIAYCAGNNNSVSGPGVTNGEIYRIGNYADSGGGDEYLIPLAAIDDLGVAGDESNAGFVAGSPHGVGNALQVGERQTFLQDEGGGEPQWPRAADSQVIHRAVNREFADVAAGKKDGANYKRIGRK